MTISPTCSEVPFWCLVGADLEYKGTREGAIHSFLRMIIPASLCSSCVVPVEELEKEIWKERLPILLMMVDVVVDVFRLPRSLFNIQDARRRIEVNLRSIHAVIQVVALPLLVESFMRHSAMPHVALTSSAISTA